MMWVGQRDDDGELDSDDDSGSAMTQTPGKALSKTWKLEFDLNS